MDGVPGQDGHWNFRLGPVEKWIVGLGASLLTLALGTIYLRIDSQLETQGKTLGVLVTQNAVMTTQLSTMNSQLANVPGLTDRVSRLEVKDQAQDESIKELRSVRGLK